LFLILFDMFLVYDPSTTPPQNHVGCF